VRPCQTGDSGLTGRARFQDRRLGAIRGALSTPGYFLALAYKLHSGHDMYLVRRYGRIFFGYRNKLQLKPTNREKNLEDYLFKALRPTLNLKLVA